MTTWYAQNSSVNINSANEWNDAPTGTGSYLTWASLGTNDILAANGKTAIAVNVSLTCLRLSTAAEGGTAGGGFTCGATVAINANLQGGTTTCLTVGSGGTVTGIGTSTGGSANPSHGCLVNHSTADVTMTDATAGSVAGAAGARCDSGTLRVTGTSTGSGAYYGVYAGAGTVTIGTAQGGTGINSGLFTATGSPSCSVTLAVGGSGITAASGVYCQAGSVTVTTAKGISGGGIGAFVTTGGTMTVDNTDLSGGGYPVGVGGTGVLKLASGVPIAFTLKGTTTLTPYFDPTLLPKKGYVDNSISYGSSTYESLYGTVAGTSTGTLVNPPAAKVLEGEAYGYSGHGYMGVYHETLTSEVKSGTTFGPNSSYLGTYSAVDPADIVSAQYVLTGHNNYVGGSAGTLTLPTASHVLNDQTYGVGGTGSVGTLTLPVGGTKILTSESAFGISGTSITPSATLPVASHVLNDQTYGIGGTGSTGTLTLPTASHVLNDQTYGVAGTGSTGTLTLPAAGDVQETVSFGIGGSGSTGTFLVPTASQVEAGVAYGAGGTEFLGTLVNSLPAPTTGCSSEAQLALAGFADAGMAEAIVYRPSTGGTRTLYALVKRLPAETLPGSPASVRAPRVEISVLNDSTYGISATELNVGGDRVDVAAGAGGTPSTRPLGRPIRQDSDWITLGVN